MNTQNNIVMTQWKRDTMGEMHNGFIIIGSRTLNLRRQFVLNDNSSGFPEQWDHDILGLL